MIIPDKKSLRILLALRRKGFMADDELRNITDDKLGIGSPFLAMTNEYISRVYGDKRTELNSPIPIGWQTNLTFNAFIEQYRKSEFRARAPIIISIISIVIAAIALLKSFLPEILVILRELPQRLP